MLSPQGLSNKKPPLLSEAESGGSMSPTKDPYKRGDVRQIELDFIEDNKRARGLYEKMDLRLFRQDNQIIITRHICLIK